MDLEIKGSYELSLELQEMLTPIPIPEFDYSELEKKNNLPLGSYKTMTDLETFHKLPQGILFGITQTETGSFKDRANVENPNSKAKGWFQHIPMMVEYHKIDPTDFWSSASGTAEFLAQKLKQYKGDFKKVLASYNWGEGNIAKYGMEKMPSETKKYLKDVEKFKKQFIQDKNRNVEVPLSMVGPDLFELLKIKERQEHLPDTQGKLPPAIEQYLTGLKERIQHPLESIAESMEEFKNLPPEEQALSLLGVGSAKGVAELTKSPVSKQLIEEGSSAVWNKFKSIFSAKAIEYAEKDAKDPLSRYSLVWMSPKEFKSLAKKRTVFSEEPLKEKWESIKRGLQGENLLDDIPYLQIMEEEGKHPRIWGHEGRHRSDVFQQLGIDKIPVILGHNTKRWGQLTKEDIPKKILNEDREELLDFNPEFIFPWKN